VTTKNDESCSTKKNIFKSRQKFKGLELSKMKNSIMQNASVNDYCLENSMKQSYTARASNSKILNNYNPMFAVNKETRNLARNGSSKRLGYSHSYLQYDENSAPSTMNILQPTSNLNTKTVVDRLNQKLKKMSSNKQKIKRISNLTKLTDLSASSVNNQSNINYFNLLGLLRKPSSRGRFQKMSIFDYSANASREISTDNPADHSNDLDSTLKLYPCNNSMQSKLPRKKSLKDTKKRNDASIYYKRLIRV
jgi:hypothetical protein